MTLQGMFVPHCWLPSPVQQSRTFLVRSAPDQHASNLLGESSESRSGSVGAFDRSIVVLNVDVRCRVAARGDSGGSASVAEKLLETVAICEHIDNTDHANHDAEALETDAKACLVTGFCRRQQQCMA